MSEKPIDFVYKARGIEFAGSDVARIIEGKKEDWLTLKNVGTASRDIWNAAKSGN